MKAHRRIATTVAAVLLLGLAACATEDSFDESVAENTSAIHLCPDGEYPPCAPDPDTDPPPTTTPPPPPRDPSRPRRPGLSTLRIPTTVLNTVLKPRLYGTYISIDTTKTAPPIAVGGAQSCHRQGGDDAYNEALAECRMLHGPARLACAREVEETYPLVCLTAGTPYYSYIAFPQQLKADFPQIQDEAFDLKTIDRDTWYGMIHIDLNQIRSVIGQQLLSFYTGGGPNPAFLGMFLDVVSGSPTAPCAHDGVLPCPDVTLNNMKLQIALTGLRPDPSDATRVSFSDVFVYFTFDRDVNNVPEWLVDAFYDLDWLIQSKVAQNLHSALMARQAGLTKLLTAVVEQYRLADFTHPPPIQSIDEVMADGNYIYVHYVAGP
jgi:hypothetical protein